MSLSKPRARREWIVAYVPGDKRVPLADVRKEAVTRWKCSNSTFYEDVAWLVAFRKLQRIPTGHGDDLAVWGTLRGVADPTFVRERARGVLNGKLTKELRTRYAADLLNLAGRSYLLPDEALLKLFRAVIRRPNLPGRAQVLELLKNLAARAAAHVTSQALSRTPRAPGDLDYPVLLETLRRGASPALLDQIGRDIDVASWGCEILLNLWVEKGKGKLARLLLDRALAKPHPIPSFERAVPALAGVIREAIAPSGDAALRFTILLKLDQALNDRRRTQIRGQARMLRDELGSAILPPTWDS